MNALAILITGASTGIGRACALELDRRGLRVFAGVRSQTAGDELRASASSRLTPVLIDVTDAALIAAAAESVSIALGQSGLDGLVNNAGIAVPGPVEGTPIAAWRKQLEVNVIGQVAVIQAFLPLLRRARGRIVNISSVSGGLATPYLGAYCASKFAMEAITDALRTELRPWGIAVLAVEPGPIATPIWKKSDDLASQLAGQVSPTVLSLYEPHLEAFRKAVADSARKAAPVEYVVRAVAHALTARRPKTRYYLGWSVRVCFKGMKMLPDRLRDWIVRKAVGLP
jgi:NAD(P)-dependent dehydrogenase (short-subunit alcohol dehydrogenase family)